MKTLFELLGEPLELAGDREQLFFGDGKRGLLREHSDACALIAVLLRRRTFEGH
jgi:hypothetical protein